MEEFNTLRAMSVISKKISQTQPCPGDLYFTSFYYRKLIRMLKEAKKLVLFGAGRYGEIIFEALEQEGIRTVQCFCDNSAKLSGSFLCGLQVLSPQYAVEQYHDACFVVTPKDYENEILRQLIHMGIDIENIVIFNIKNTGLITGDI